MSVAILVVTAVLAAQIEMRAGEMPPPGDVLNVSVEGVTVGFAPPAAGGPFVGPVMPPVLVGWDRVRALPESSAQAGAPFLALADKAWRARTRVERDDLAGAEPLLEDLYTTYAGLAGPTAAMVGENLLKCRLARGAQTLAIGPWLTWLGSGVAEAGPTPVRRPKDKEETEIVVAVRAPSSLDPGSGLVPALPPMWLDGPGVQAFARAKAPPLAAPPAHATPVQKKAVMLAALYWQSARFECALDAGPVESGSDDAGVSLVQQVVLARVGDSAQREQARKLLQARIKARPEPWIEAWCRAAVGRSLLREDSPELRRLGVIELLHVPARMPDECPYLTGVALADAAVALLKLGERAGADRVRTELLENFAGHPALDWAPISAWPAPTKPPAGAS